MKTKSWLERILHLWPTKILSIAAAVLLYFVTSLINLGSREISLPIHYVLAPGLTQSADFPTKASVTLRGDPDPIFDILEEDIEVRADLSRHTQPGQYQVSLQLKRKGQAARVEPLDIKMSPGTVTVRIEPAMTRTVPINLVFATGPKPGYQLVAWDLKPASATVSGPASLIQTIAALDTEPVDLSNRSSDFSLRVKLANTDTLVRVVGTDSTEARISLGESVERQVFSGLLPRVIGLAPGLMVDAAELPACTVSLQAESRELTRFEASQIRLLIDASQISAPGRYRLKLICDAPDRSLVLAVEPHEVELEVKLSGNA